MALTVLVFLASIGALTAPRAALLLGVIVAALATTLMWNTRGQGAASGPPLAVIAACAAAHPAAVAGGTALGLGATGVLGGSLVLSALAVTGWRAPAAATDTAPRCSTAAPEPDGESLDGLLRLLPLDVLCDEWSRTLPRGDGAAEHFAARVRLRFLLIDELHRRDAAGTSRWLSEAPEEPPDLFVRDVRDQSA